MNRPILRRLPLPFRFARLPNHVAIFFSLFPHPGSYRVTAMHVTTRQETALSRPPFSRKDRLSRASRAPARLPLSTAHRRRFSISPTKNAKARERPAGYRKAHYKGGGVMERRSKGVGQRSAALDEVVDLGLRKAVEAVEEVLDLVSMRGTRESACQLLWHERPGRGKAKRTSTSLVRGMMCSL